MTNLPQVQGNFQTMSSREIAELCDKRHDHVCRDIENLNLEYGKLSLPKVGECDFTVNQDFTTVSKNLENGGRSIEYYITLDMAKELSMVERNEKLCDYYLPNHK